MIASIGLPVLCQPITEPLADLERQLEEGIQAAIRRIAASENTHFQITRRGPTLRWTLAYPRGSDPVNHPLFDLL